MQEVVDMSLLRILLDFRELVMAADMDWAEQDLDQRSTDD